MTTPRVTVPVELAERIKSFLLQAREDRKNNGRTKQALEINTMLHGLITAPAAPAPEGGAGFYKVKAAIERAMMDERDGKPCGCIIEAGCESRGYADPAYAASGFIWAATDAVMQALAPREEAPAEAGEMEWAVDYNAVVAVSAYLQNQRLFDSAKAVERMLSRAAAYRNCRDAHAELAALRAQPQARSGEGQ